MTDANERIDDTPPKDVIRCQRTDQEYDCAEHERCPYCYGKAADVRAGEHSKFCEFDPERDPISFGFPVDADRWAHG